MFVIDRCMDKDELLQWLKNEHRAWLSVTQRFDSKTWTKPGIAGYWSMKDVLAHLIGWNRRLVNNMESAVSDTPLSPSPWPANLKSDDEINRWFYETNRGKSVSELLDEEREVFEHVLKIVNTFPDNVEIETVRQGSREYYIVHMNDKKIIPGEFFDHYHDDHEGQILSFLEKEN